MAIYLIYPIYSIYLIYPICFDLLNFSLSPPHLDQAPRGSYLIYLILYLIYLIYLTSHSGRKQKDRQCISMRIKWSLHLRSDPTMCETLSSPLLYPPRPRNGRPLSDLSDLYLIYMICSI